MIRKKIDIPELRYIASVVSTVTKLDINRNTRRREFVQSRWIYFRIARNLTAYSLEEIGGQVGRDHATVLHGLYCFDEYIWKDNNWKNLFIRSLDLVSAGTIPTAPFEPGTLQTLLDKIDQISNDFSQYKRMVREREYSEKSILDLYRSLNQDEKDRLLLIGRTIKKVNESSAKIVASD